MRNKKLLSTVVASALVATTMAVPVMAADGDTIDVDVATKTAVIKVAVPTAMSIAVDQFEMVDQGTQIYSEEFTMQNNSAIDVKVGITSTADLKSTTKLVATKAEAASDDAATGEAWMAVAAQTAAGSYNDGTATALKDLSEENANVTTFVQGTEADAAKGVAEQTYYLAKATGTVGYKLLNANESAADIAYAQFYELTAETVADGDALADLLKAGDVYVATAAADDGQALEFVAKGGTHTYAASEIYYTAAATATAKASIDADKLYVYADGTADAAKGTAAFRYIGNLSGAQETWSDDDITDVHIKYDIVGVTQTGYEKVENDCTYGLYAGDPAVIIPESDGTTDVTISYTGAKPSSLNIVPVSITGSNTASFNLPEGNGNLTISDSAVTLSASYISMLKNAATRGTGTYKFTINEIDYTFVIK